MRSQKSNRKSLAPTGMVKEEQSMRLESWQWRQLDSNASSLQSGFDLFCSWGIAVPCRGPKTKPGQWPKNQANGIDGKGRNKYTSGHKGEGLLERANVYCLLPCSFEPSPRLLRLSLGQCQDFKLTLVWVVLREMGARSLLGHKAVWLSVQGEKRLSHMVNIHIYARFSPRLRFIFTSTSSPTLKLWSPQSSWLIPLHLLSDCLFASKVRQLGFADLLIFLICI